MHFYLFSKYCYTKDVLSLPFKQEKSKKCIRRWRTMVFSLQGNGHDVHRILSQAPSRMIKRKENDFAFECWCHDSTIAASVTIPSGCLAWHHIIVMIIIMAMWITTTGVGSKLKKKDRNLSMYHHDMALVGLFNNRTARKKEFESEAHKTCKQNKLRNGKMPAESNYLCDNITENNNEECYFQNWRCTIYQHLYSSLFFHWLFTTENTQLILSSLGFLACLF